MNREFGVPLPGIGISFSCTGGRDSSIKRDNTERTDVLSIDKDIAEENCRPFL